MYQVIDGIPVWGKHDEATIAQIKRCAADERAVGAALLADGHLGYSVPIGGVVAYRDAISPNAVGFDISCGNKAARTTIRADDIRADIGRIMDEVARTVVFGIGRGSGKRADHSLFDDPTWRDVREVGKLKNLAREQLGTVGSGNHYVDLFEDEGGYVWVGVHFGSRGFGHRTCTGFLNLAADQAFDARAPGESMDAPAVVLPLHGALGQAYLAAMTLAGRYAYAGRDLVVRQVLDILGAEAVDEVHNHHNYAWQETHDGETVMVVRKGATPAFPGQRGFIGGSMGDISVIV
ncbi:MAG: RtcB family protein, partial [Thermomicrobiales bacterium]